MNVFLASSSLKHNEIAFKYIIAIAHISFQHAYNIAIINWEWIKLTLFKFIIDNTIKVILPAIKSISM